MGSLVVDMLFLATGYLLGAGAVRLLATGVLQVATRFRAWRKSRTSRPKRWPWGGGPC